MKNGAWDATFQFWICPEIKTGYITNFPHFPGKLPHSKLEVYFYL